MNAESKPEAAAAGDTALPDPSLFQPSDKPRARRKRRPMEEPGGLSMNSLMDIMTILLVFLLKSYSTSPVQIKGGDDLKLPASTSQIKPLDSTSITVTLNSVLVDDEPVLRVDNGVIAESDRSSGGFLIDPLFQRLQAEVDHQNKIAKFNKQAKFEGMVIIVSDRHVPFSLLSQVMYTAGQAQFSKFKFAVIKNS